MGVLALPGDPARPGEKRILCLKRTSYTQGTPNWVDLQTTDPDAMLRDPQGGAFSIFAANSATS